MDRSLVEMERSRSGTVSSRGIGPTVKQPTTQPRNGTVAECPHWRNIAMNPGGHGARDRKDPVWFTSDGQHFVCRARPVTVPMQLVCTRRTMPAADVTRNRLLQRPFVNQAPNTHARQGVQ
jgi:hypothetical protein